MTLTSICCPGEEYEDIHRFNNHLEPRFWAHRGLGTSVWWENAAKHFSIASSLVAYFFPFWFWRVSICCIFIYRYYLNTSQLVVWNHKFEVRSCGAAWSNWIWSRRYISFHLLLNSLEPSVVCVCVRSCMALITAKVLSVRSRNSSCLCQCVKF